MDAARFTTASLRAAAQGEAVARMLAAAIAAVEPAAALRAVLHASPEGLHAGAQFYPWAGIARVFVLAFGKAAAPMSAAAAEVLGDRLSGGIVVVKDGHTTPQPPAPLQVFVAGHPVPDERSIVAGAAIAALLEQTRADDLVLALISGGGSALLNLPVAGVSLPALQSLTSQLLACGATINEINCLRKHLDQLKGGGLARRAAPARLATLVLSDVVGNPLDVIASGPTVADPSTYADAFAILSRYDLSAPPEILAHLQAGAAGAQPETLKAQDPVLQHSPTTVIGDNRSAALAALQAARESGFHALLLSSFAQGEARTLGGIAAAIAREIHASANPLPRPACVLIGGESTVTLRGDGRGGRNQELALAAALEIAGLPETLIIGLATDGGDGPTDAAGAVASGETVARAQALGLDAAAHLARNDAYHFFAPLGDLLLIGPSGTNVNDLCLIVVGAPT